VLISYTPIGSTENEVTLCMNYTDRAWSRYDYGFNCFGAYKFSGSAPTLDDIDESWDELEISFDDNTRQAGYPITLAGDSSGYVWKINDGASDNGEDINFEVLSGRWNPWLKVGRKSRFGWLMFFVERDEGIDFEVSFYTNRETTPHTTVTVNCDDGSNSEKVWVRADNGAIGDFHRVKISNDAASQTMKIFAMIAYMKPAGALR
jgi:hypothetical protein